MTDTTLLPPIHAPARPQPAMYCGSRNPHYERWEDVTTDNTGPLPASIATLLPPAPAAPARIAQPLIIGLSGFAGSGKSTAASILEAQHGFVRIRFAGPLKSMLRQIGLTDYDIEGEGKEVGHHLLQGKTPRYAMQTLGTEWGRDLIGENFWAAVWADSVLASLREGAKGIVVDDLRFPNELETLKELGGWHVRLIRSRGHDPMTLSAHAHPSERALADAHPDSWLQNTGTVAELEVRVRAMLLLLADLQEEHIDVV